MLFCFINNLLLQNYAKQFITNLFLGGCLPLLDFFPWLGRGFYEKFAFTFFWHFHNLVFFSKPIQILGIFRTVFVQLFIIA